ncbi:hypothetical protein DPMN_126544 [Dreissena polymorpha]|uniref:Uncharacterized protein n=1 Tax=Dreissena polymorpha TaxID=45954 RepID=A0A9D4JY16_DREPO|nr:hypothetical protein DPMN_126544 [Dreissena polymorpha]
MVVAVDVGDDEETEYDVELVLVDDNREVKEEETDEADDIVEDDDYYNDYDDDYDVDDDRDNNNDYFFRGIIVVVVVDDNDIAPVSMMATTLLRIRRLQCRQAAVIVPSITFANVFGQAHRQGIVEDHISILASIAYTRQFWNSYICRLSVKI